MNREWKPGDVRLATVNGERMLVLRGRGIFEGNWYTQGPVAGSRLSVSDAWLLDERPLVVIDPEDREAVERLLSYYVAPFEDFVTDGRMDHMQSALREFADPTPPKPDEPTGLGAVVEDAEGVQYVRVTGDDEGGPWVKTPAEPWQVHCFLWSEITIVRVLSEGVSND